MKVQPVPTVVVQKYGGTSLATEDALHRAVAHISATHEAGLPVVVVVSARGDLTDQLAGTAAQLTSSRTSPAQQREIDQLLSTGENISAATMALALLGRGVPAVSLTAAQISIRARGTHGEGRIDTIDTAAVRSHLARDGVVVVTGFQGVADDGSVLTLGRGGSDTTAVALAAALEAGRCEIYTDVPGVYTADPRLLPEAQLIPTISSPLMAEMAHAGAAVVHRRAVEIATLHGVELAVRSSILLNPGTTVIPRESPDMIEPVDTVAAVVHDLDVSHVLLDSDSPHAVREVIALLADRSVEVDMLATSSHTHRAVTVGFTVRRSQLPLAADALEAVATRGSVRVDREVAKVSVVGTGLPSRPHYLRRLLNSLADAGIRTRWLSMSETRFSVVVPTASALHAVRLLHHEFDTGLEPATVGATA